MLHVRHYYDVAETIFGLIVLKKHHKNHDGGLNYFREHGFFCQPPPEPE